MKKSKTPEIQPVFVAVQDATAEQPIRLGPYKSMYSLTVITTALNRLGIKYTTEEAPCRPATDN